MPIDDWGLEARDSGLGSEHPERSCLDPDAPIATPLLALLTAPVASFGLGVFRIAAASAVFGRLMFGRAPAGAL